MYKKAPNGMVAISFISNDPNLTVGQVACLIADLAVAPYGGPAIGEVVAIEKHCTPWKVTVELFANKVFDFVAGAGGVAVGQQANVGAAANTLIAPATGALGQFLAIKGATAGNSGVAIYSPALQLATPISGDAAATGTTNTTPAMTTVQAPGTQYA